MFCASCSSTPQLIAGGRRPRPRKLSVVSLMIMAGSARLTAAMMWLEERRHHVAEDDPHLAGAGEFGRGDEVLLAQREESSAHHARELGPADQRDDHRDGEIDLGDGPGRWAARPPGPSTAGWSGSSGGSRSGAGSRCRSSRHRAPEMPPSSTPRNRLTATPTRPMVSEIRVASISRDQSRGRAGRCRAGRAPSCGCGRSSTPSRCRLVGNRPEELVADSPARTAPGRRFAFGSGV